MFEQIGDILKMGRMLNDCNIISCDQSKLAVYLYHKVITRFVRFPVWSVENDRASPKSASFKFPSLSINRLEPARKGMSKKLLIK